MLLWYIEPSLPSLSKPSHSLLHTDPRVHSGEPCPFVHSSAAVPSHSFTTLLTDPGGLHNFQDGLPKDTCLSHPRCWSRRRSTCALVCSGLQARSGSRHLLVPNVLWLASQWRFPRGHRLYFRHCSVWQQLPTSNRFRCLCPERQEVV